MNYLSNVEIVLMELLAEKRELSGYEISRLVRERGFREWANIGTTSIYVGLEKLKRRGMVDFRLDTQKSGRGPLPNKYCLNQEGLQALIKEVLRCLKTAKPHQGCFDLGLAGIPLLERDETVDALKERAKGLREEGHRLMQVYWNQGGDGLPLSVRALFDHSQRKIQHEREFVLALIGDIQREPC